MKYIIANIILLLLLTKIVNGQGIDTQQYRIIHDTTYVYNKSKKNKHYKYKNYNNSVLYAGYNIYFAYSEVRVVGSLLISTNNHTGIAYERRVYKNFWAKAGYYQWSENSTWGYSEWGFIEPKRGLLYLANNFKLADLSVLYRPNIFKRHKITVGCGISYASGDAILYDTTIGYALYCHQANIKYWGILPSVSYDYLLFNNRVKVGFELTYRKYFNSIYVEKEYGFHVGINF